MHYIHRFAGTAMFASLAGVCVAAAAPGIVLGDSIGVGLAAAGGVKALAHNSVTIGSGDIARQIGAVPAGAVAFISLGTNDAVGSIKGIEARIDRTVAAVQAAGIKAVWVGPVCVIKPWNETVTKLDAVLRRKLAGRIAYVSLAGDTYCDAGIRGHDGVHFSFAGYRRLWAQARSAAGEEIEGSSAGRMPKATRKKHRKTHRRHHHAVKADLFAPSTSPRAITHIEIRPDLAGNRAWRLLATGGNALPTRT